jgi:hypothetical protein
MSKRKREIRVTSLVMVVGALGFFALHLSLAAGSAVRVGPPRPLSATLARTPQSYPTGASPSPSPRHRQTR